MGARKIVEADRAAVLAAVREGFVGDTRVTVALTSGGELRASKLTGSTVALMPAGPSAYTRKRSGGGRETLGVMLYVTPDGELSDPATVGTHVDVVIRRAVAAVESHLACEGM